MKLAYLVAAFFVVCVLFSCANEEITEDVSLEIEESLTPQYVYDTIITFDPETFEESVQIVRSELDPNAVETSELHGEVATKERILYVKNEETGVMDTVVVVSIDE